MRRLLRAHPPPRRQFTKRRLATLALAPDANRADIVQLGRRFSIVTLGTSLLVLETLDQYVEHGITPPVTLPDLRQAYAQRVDEASRVKAGKLAGKHGFALLQHGARLQTVVSGLEVVGKIAADADGEQRKKEGSEPHCFPLTPHSSCPALCRASTS